MAELTVAEKYLKCLNYIGEIQTYNIKTLDIILSIKHIHRQIDNIYNIIETFDNYDIRNIPIHIINMIKILQNYVENILEKHIK